MALQNLFADEYNSKNKLSLDRCNQVSSYEVLKLLSENDLDFPDSPDDPKPLGVLNTLPGLRSNQNQGTP